MIQMKQAFTTALNKHYRCPKGRMGRIAGEVMVRQHRPETAWTLHLLDIQPTDTVLEVGFGAGQGIKLAAERVTSGRIRGIDLSEEMVRVATRRNASAIKAGRVALSQGSITALPFEDQYFDKIMTIHTSSRRVVAPAGEDSGFETELLAHVLDHIFWNLSRIRDQHPLHPCPDQDKRSVEPLRVSSQWFKKMQVIKCQSKEAA